MYLQHCFHLILVIILTALKESNPKTQAIKIKFCVAQILGHGSAGPGGHTLGDCRYR